MADAKPTTAEQIVDLIRQPHRKYVSAHAISTREAIDLIEQYAAVAAAEASIKTTEKAYEKTMAVFDEAMSRPLATPPAERSA